MRSVWTLIAGLVIGFLACAFVVSHDFRPDPWLDTHARDGKRGLAALTRLGPFDSVAVTVLAQNPVKFFKVVGADSAVYIDFHGVWSAGLGHETARTYAGAVLEYVDRETMEPETHFVWAE